LPVGVIRADGGGPPLPTKRLIAHATPRAANISAVATGEGMQTPGRLPDGVSSERTRGQYHDTTWPHRDFGDDFVSHLMFDPPHLCGIVDAP
jgi:hypothetical protein